MMMFMVFRAEEVKGVFGEVAKAKQFKVMAKNTVFLFFKKFAIELLN